MHVCWQQLEGKELGKRTQKDEKVNKPLHLWSQGACQQWVGSPTPCVTPCVCMGRAFTGGTTCSLLPTFLSLSLTMLESLTGGWQPTVNVSWLAEAYLVKGCEHRGSGFFPLFPAPELLAECFCLWIWTFPQRADPLENVCQWRAVASWFGCRLQLCFPNLLLSCSCNVWFLCLHLK